MPAELTQDPSTSPQASHQAPAFVPSARFAGLCLISASLSGLLVMALHPTGGQLVANFNVIMRLNIAVHSLALLATPVLFIGALGITASLATSRNLAVSALVFFGFASFAVIIAGAMSGLMVPPLIARMMQSPANTDPNNTLRLLLHFAGNLNQSFARISVVGDAIAIFLWSCAMLRTRAFARGLAAYGCIFAVASSIATAAGLPLNVHIFGAIVLGQAIWFCFAGKGLLHSAMASPAPPSVP